MSIISIQSILDLTDSDVDKEIKEENSPVVSKKKEKKKKSAMELYKIRREEVCHITFYL